MKGGSSVDSLTPNAKKARAAYMREYNKHLTEEQKEKRREYARKWRRNNPDKIKATKIRYWNRQGEKLAETLNET